MSGSNEIGWAEDDRGPSTGAAPCVVCGRAARHGGPGCCSRQCADELIEQHMEERGGAGDV